MKVDKKTQEMCIKKIKEFAVKKGYKKIRSSIYKFHQDYIVFVHFLVVESEYLLYNAWIKKNTFDEIFWKIMKMEENMLEPDSLKIIGAFSAPSVEISGGKIPISENIEYMTKEVVNLVDNDIDMFISKNELISYIFANDNIIDKEILQSLSYIDRGDVENAIEIAKKQLADGKRGRFVNGNKGFFQLLLEMYR